MYFGPSNVIIFLMILNSNAASFQDEELKARDVISLRSYFTSKESIGRDPKDDEEGIKKWLEDRYKFKNDNASTRFKIARDGRDDPLSQIATDQHLATVFRSYAVRRIVGGMETSINMYPYTVGISRNGKHWCGGSIIDEQWVITAGHCLEQAFDGDKRKLSPFIIRAGSSFHNRGGYQARVNKVFFPPQYSPGNADYDFSLLRLDRPMPIGRNIAVLNLPAKDYLIQHDDLLIVTGWGSTDITGYGHIPDRIRFVPVPVMREEDCQDAYRFYITPRMLCAGYATGGKDACNVLVNNVTKIESVSAMVAYLILRISKRYSLKVIQVYAPTATHPDDEVEAMYENHDSGGPAVRDGVLLGIVSFGGKHCGDPRSPGVYSRVTEITDWVEATITRNEAYTVPELKAKIRKARQREKELQRFKARVEDKKNKIKNWLRETLKSPTFLKLAKKKLKEAGFYSRRSLDIQDESLIDDRTLDEINLSNLISERILGEYDDNESEILLTTLALQEVIRGDGERMIPVYRKRETNEDIDEELLAYIG